MKSTARWMLGLTAALLLSLGAEAQEGGAVVTAQPGMEDAGPGPVTIGFGGPVELLGFGGLRGGKVVKGAPFSAVATSETKQVLADGTTITHKFQSNLYRDSEGRFRKESTLPAIGPLPAGGKPHALVMIVDPVAGATYALDPEQKIAHKMPVHDGGPGKGGPGKFGPGADVRFEAGPGGVVRYEKFGGESDANLKKETMGTQTINGISAEGTRYTRTIPVGEIGNDRALTIVKEEWYSPDLQIVVQSKHNDPMFGQTTYSLTNVQRVAPSANLFAVPSDYTIKEGPMGFRVRHHAEKGKVAPPDEPGGPGLDM